MICLVTLCPSANLIVNFGRPHSSKVAQDNCGAIAVSAADHEGAVMSPRPSVAAVSDGVVTVEGDAQLLASFHHPQDLVTV